ncbi:MAG: PDZ domain-containing protein [Ardenticatenales bacterium]|nr:PDZ domain-containing protein [Ardenticatenales bacterium]
MQHRLLKGTGIIGALLLAFALVILAGNGIAQAARLTDQMRAAVVAEQEALAQQAAETEEIVEEGILVASVEPEGAAAQAGVRRGDILLTLGGQTLTHIGDLHSALAEQEPGKQVELSLMHGDEQRTLTVTLGERQDHAYLGLIPCGEVHMEHFLEGAVLPNMLPGEGFSVQGALIVEVTGESPASEAGLKPGTLITAVDGEAITEPTSLRERMDAREPGQTVTLTLRYPDMEEEQRVEVMLSAHPEDGERAYLGVRIGPFFVMRHLSEAGLPSLPELHDEVMPFEGAPLPFMELPAPHPFESAPGEDL